MFQLIIDGLFAEVSPATKLRLDVTSSLGDSDLLKGKVVYPLDLPHCDQNAMVFKNANIMHVIYDYKIYQAQYSFKGKQFISGELILLGTNSTGYHITIIDKGMSNEFIEKLMTEIDIPEFVMVEKPHSELAEYMTKVAKGLISTDFELPMVYAPNFYENNEDFGNEDIRFIADPDEDGIRGKYENRWNVDHYNWNIPSVDQPMNIYTFVPYPKLFNVLKKVFNINEIDIFGSFLNKAQADNIILKNNRTLDDNFKYLIAARFRKKASQVLYRNNDNSSEPSASYLLSFSKIGDYLSNFDTAREFNPRTGGWSGVTGFDAYLVPQVPDFSGIVCEYSIDIDLMLYIFRSSDITTVSVEIWIAYPGIYSASYSLLKSTSFSPPSGSFIHYPINYRESISLAPGCVICFKLKHSGFGTTSTSSHGNSSVGTILASAESFIEIKNLTLENYNAGAANFKLNQHLPEISVGEFINVLRQVYGVVIYTDAEKREIELSMLSDLQASEGYVDLSNYLVPNSLERSFDEVLTQKITYKHEIETPSNSNFNLPICINFRNLPTASVGDKCIVLADGMVYKYTLNTDEERYDWTPAYPYSKAKHEIADNETVIDCTILANCERISKLFPTTTEKVISDKFGGDGNNTLGVLYYHGLTKDLGSIYYPFASAYALDVNANQLPIIPMFESGSGTNGELFTNPYFESSKSYESFKAQFKIPLNIMEDLIYLLKPQRCSPANAKRKIMFNSVKFIPLQMSFILDGEQEYIETEITFIKDAR